MIGRRTFLALALAICGTGASASDDSTAPEWPAEAAQLSADLITALLSGNTAVGDWSGTPYRQYFAANGRTVYLPAGGRPDQGRWRVNAETDQYESWWQNSDWTGYTIIETGNGYAWVSRGKLHAFTIVEGDQLQP